MTKQNQPLICETVEDTPQGHKAVLFSYKLYLLPDGNLQSSISNVDPKLIQQIFTEGNLEPETIGFNVGAVNFLLAAIVDLDNQLEKHLRSLS